LGSFLLKVRVVNEEADRVFEHLMRPLRRCIDEEGELSGSRRGGMSSFAVHRAGLFVGGALKVKK